MSAWIVLTTADLSDYQVAALVDAARSAALGSGQTDPFLRVMPDVATRIRAEVRGCASNRVSLTENAIPADLKSVGIYLVLEAMLARLSLQMSDELRTLVKDAKDYLKRVSRCEVPIDQPDDPDETPSVQSAVAAPSYEARESTYRDQEGL